MHFYLENLSVKYNDKNGGAGGKEGATELGGIHYDGLIICMKS
jgi:hypothetical protein